jgi:hypothetical protein
MANHPLFATLNHFATDLGIPSESESSRVGIIYIFGNDTFAQKRRSVRIRALFSARVFILSNTREETP